MERRLCDFWGVTANMEMTPNPPMRSGNVALSPEWTPHSSPHVCNGRGLPDPLEGGQFLKSMVFLCVKDMGARAAPEFVPHETANVFWEVTTSIVTNRPNAAAAVFRFVIDLTIRLLLPNPDDPSGPNAKVRAIWDCGLRLPWVFTNARRSGRPLPLHT